MFDDLFKNLQDVLTAKVQEAARELEGFFTVPEAQEPFTAVRRFTIDDQPLTQGGITFIGEGCWRIEAYGDKSILSSIQEPLRKVILFEAAEPSLSDAILACRFQARALDTADPIAVQLGRSQKGQMGTTTRYWSTQVNPNQVFQFFEVRAHFKRDSTPAKAQIAMEFASSGVLEIRNIELLQAPVKS